MAACHHSDSLTAWVDCFCSNRGWSLERAGKVGAAEEAEEVSLASRWNGGVKHLSSSASPGRHDMRKISRYRFEWDETQRLRLLSTGGTDEHDGFDENYVVQLDEKTSVLGV